MTTPFERLVARDPTDTDDGVDSTTHPTGTASHTSIAGEDVDLEEPLTGITFEDADNYLSSGEYGRPRPREFWHAKQLGQTPPMRLIKHGITQQLTGGHVTVTSEDELRGPAADLAGLIEDVYNGSHYNGIQFDDLVTGAVNDLVDIAFAYWEALPSSDGQFPVAGFKPLPALQVQHNLDRGELADDPAYYWVPFRRSQGTISTGDRDPVELDAEQVVTMRGPLTYEADRHYGKSLALKVREWLELIIDVDVHQKRHYNDSQLPAGFLHFMGNVSDDDLTEMEQDIKEAAGDPHELVTATSEEGASWIPVGGEVVDLDAIAEQKWYFKLVFAAAGLNANEVGILIGEDSGFAKETAGQVRQVFKKVTKPYKSAIMDPQQQVRDTILDTVGGTIDTTLQVDLERFDPLQEQVEREEVLSQFDRGIPSLNEVRGATGREAVEVPFEVGGQEFDLAEMPKYAVEKLAQIESPDVPFGGDGGGDTGGAAAITEEGPPDFEQDPVLTEQEAAQTLGVPASEYTLRQLENTISVQSSFINSAAYDRTAPLMQITFDRTGAPDATYWYADVEEFRFFNFLQAGSKGQYFNRFIRHTGDPGYPYARVN